MTANKNSTPPDKPDEEHNGDDWQVGASEIADLTPIGGAATALPPVVEVEKPDPNGPDLIQNPQPVQPEQRLSGQNQADFEPPPSP